MTDRVSQVIEKSRISLSEGDVCKAMAAIDAIRGIGWNQKGSPEGVRLISLAELLEGIIYGGTFEPGESQ